MRNFLDFTVFDLNEGKKLQDVFNLNIHIEITAYRVVGDEEKWAYYTDQ